METTQTTRWYVWELGTGKRGHYERFFFSPEESLESLENGRILLCLPHSGGSLEFPDSLESLEDGLFWKDGRAPKYRTKGCSRYWRPKFVAGNGSNAAKTSVRAPGLSADEREHPFVWYFGAGWKDPFSKRPLLPNPKNNPPDGNNPLSAFWVGNHSMGGVAAEFLRGRGGCKS